MARGASLEQARESAEDRFPGQMVWGYNRALRVWFVIPADSALKRTLAGNCVRQYTGPTPPPVSPPDCPDLPFTVELDPRQLAHMRANDDARAMQPDPATWDLADLARASSPLTGSRRKIVQRLGPILDRADFPRHLLTPGFLDRVRRAFGDQAVAYIQATPAERLALAQHLPGLAPPDLAAADVILSFLEALYEERTRRPRPPTPELRDPGSGPGGFRLPGFNPTYPTSRGAREPREERLDKAYLYGKARAIYYKCQRVPFLADLRRQLPEHFGPLYAMSQDAADAFLDDIEDQINALLESNDYDRETCRPRGRPDQPPPAPIEPPEEEPPPAPIETELHCYTFRTYPGGPLLGPVTATVTVGSSVLAEYPDLFGRFAVIETEFVITSPDECR